MADELTESQRDSLMSAVEKELIAFERRERELRKQERLERAAQKFPGLSRDKPNEKARLGMSRRAEVTKWVKQI